MNFVKIGGRRFALTMLAQLVTAFLQWFGRLDPAGMAYTAVITATVAAYITGQAYEIKHTGRSPAMPKEGVPQ